MAWRWHDKYCCHKGGHKGAVKCTYPFASCRCAGCRHPLDNSAAAVWRRPHNGDKQILEKKNLKMGIYCQVLINFAHDLRRKTQEQTLPTPIGSKEKQI